MLQLQKPYGPLQPKRMIQHSNDALNTFTNTARHRLALSNSILFYLDTVFEGSYSITRRSSDYAGGTSRERITAFGRCAGTSRVSLKRLKRILRDLVVEWCNGSAPRPCYGWHIEVSMREPLTLLIWRQRSERILGGCRTLVALYTQWASGSNLVRKETQNQ